MAVTGLSLGPKIAIPITITATLLFFLLINPPSYEPFYPKPKSTFHNHSRSLLDTSSSDKGGSAIINNYNTLSVPILTLTLFIQFHLLITTAHSHFSVSVTSLSSQLSLSPSMAAVTLLALGNGAPDVFSSSAALRSCHPFPSMSCTSSGSTLAFGAILSAGAFVSALAFGVVAVYSGPFPVDPATFLRDSLFYLVSTVFLFSVYLSGEILLWQAVGFVGFYVFFVGLVFWMDLGIGVGKRRRRGDVADGKKESSGLVSMGNEKKELRGEGVGSKIGTFFREFSKLWDVPISVLLKLTIPQTSPLEWNRFYRSANIALCPISLLYGFSSFMPLNHPIPFLLSNTHLPLWQVVLFASSSLSILHFIVEKEPPKTEQVPIVLAAFIMSVFWISTTAGELLNCLEALGSLLKLPPSLLGLTVLAWGNSVGDLVADVAVAKEGQPAIAMAGCFVGPMFNMLFGLGTALVTQTAEVYPQSYKLQFSATIVVAFGFLILTLMGSVLVITWHRFRVPRLWGFCLVGFYATFTALTLVIAMFSK